VTTERLKTSYGLLLVKSRECECEYECRFACGRACSGAMGLRLAQRCGILTVALGADIVCV
jgi:hypothetical protein